MVRLPPLVTPMSVMSTGSVVSPFAFVNAPAPVSVQLPDTCSKTVFS